ncbi:MAG: hypothetical protein JXJ30_04835 [Halothiobacillaceae bacterium]|nr:hypothetical protein [Halothiobacillaceae bacterium]HER35484.1 hypothetical protein [Halothiobacillaceae bacterium]
MTRPLVSLAALLTYLFLTGCGAAGPNETEVRDILQSALDPTGEVVMVETIDRLNVAQQGALWVADVTATLRFPRSLTAVVGEMGEDGSATQTLTRLGLMMRFGPFKAGETRVYDRRLRLIEGRNGWMQAEPPADDKQSAGFAPHFAARL